MGDAPFTYPEIVKAATPADDTGQTFGMVMRAVVDEMYDQTHLHRDLVDPDTTKITWQTSVGDVATTLCRAARALGWIDPKT